MERIIIPKTTPDQESFLNKMMDSAFGNAIIFDSAPTASQLKPDTWGKNGTNIFIKFSDGSVLKFSGTSVA